MYFLEPNVLYSYANQKFSTQFRGEGPDALLSFMFFRLAAMAAAGMILCFFTRRECL